MRSIILASASPRRRELLEQIGLPFTVRPARGGEESGSTTPERRVEQLSYQKALEVAGQAEEGALVIGADTMVACGEKLLGKPADREEAAETLRLLSGGVHQVYTGVTVMLREGEDYEYFTFSERTDVHVYPLSEREIRDYLDTGEPFDKAGAYGIQGRFARHIRGIEGDYANVVGLPVGRLYQELRRRGLLEPEDALGAGGTCS